MATVTLTGKVLFPDGQIPIGSLEFLGINKIEDASGNIKAPMPAQVSLDGSGAASVTLEVGEQYDVTAVVQDPATKTTARTSLGRWTAPANGEFATPKLFDGWRATLGHPNHHARSISTLTDGATATPKRGVLDIWTFTPASPPATQDSTGLRMTTGATLTRPLVDNVPAASGAIVITFTPEGWSAAAPGGVTHTLLDSTPNGANRIRCYVDTEGVCVFGVTDRWGVEKTLRGSAVGQIVASTFGEIAIEWDATGYLTCRLNGVDLVTVGDGCGLLAALPATLWVGSNNAGAQSIVGVVRSVTCYTTRYDFTTGYRLFDGSWVLDGTYRFGGRA